MSGAPGSPRIRVQHQVQGEYGSAGDRALGASADSGPGWRAVPRNEDDRDGLSDGVLLGHFIATQDDAAFEALVRRHGKMVLSLCRRVLGNAPDAEDAFQATFLILVRKLQGNELEPWLARVKATGARELRQFAHGLERDRAAVVAGLTLPYSTGPVEGHINRLKLLNEIREATRTVADFSRIEG